MEMQQTFLISVIVIHIFRNEKEERILNDRNQIKSSTIKVSSYFFLFLRKKNLSLLVVSLGADHHQHLHHHRHLHYYYYYYSQDCILLLFMKTINHSTPKSSS